MDKPTKKEIDEAIATIEKALNMTEDEPIDVRNFHTLFDRHIESQVIMDSFATAPDYIFINTNSYTFDITVYKGMPALKIKRKN
jgi:hypothetical protein